MISFSMNISYDGDGNACHSGEGYIMDANFYPDSDSIANQKQWVFSNCSLDYMDSFITSLNAYV